MPVQLTYKRVSTISKPGRYFDGGIGLHLLVKSATRKYWVFRYTDGGKRKDLGLGPFPRVGLAEARDKAQQARKLLDAGTCPIKARAEAVAAATQTVPAPTTFKSFALAWVNSKRIEWKNFKHGEQWLYTLQEYAFPVIGEKGLAEVGTEDVLAILQPIWVKRTETASRLRGRLERILAAATIRQLRTGVNPASWRGHLDSILPMPRKVTKVRHHPAIPYRALPKFIERLQGRDAMAALALEFTILTASRTGEVIGAKRDEVCGDVWIVPAGRMKAGRPHRVPLTSRTLAILGVAKVREPNSEYLFSISQKPLSNMAMATLLKRMGVKATVHGFRSSFRDWVAEETIHPGELAEAALAHVIGDKTEAAYRRGDALQRRRNLMADWEQYCMYPLSNVTALRAA